MVETAAALAREAGDLLLRHFGTLRRADAQRKGGRRRDLVSRADVEAEELLHSRIPAGDDIVAEEGHSRARGARRTWIVDPLDGTVNFLHGIPVWCVSIGIVEEGALAAAVVHAPAMGETFAAEAGKGATRNGEPIRVSGTSDLADSLLATGFAYDLDRRPDDNLGHFSDLTRASAGTRRLGSAALDLAYVACGRFDGFWELHLNPWDVAAGLLLVREAGGRVSDFAGDDRLDRLLGGGNLVASNALVHEAIRARLARPHAGPR
jgi:myo-inositol-1(or 4)-monophosphatase